MPFTVKDWLISRLKAQYGDSKPPVSPPFMKNRMVKIMLGCCEEIGTQALLIRYRLTSGTQVRRNSRSKFWHTWVGNQMCGIVESMYTIRPCSRRTTSTPNRLNADEGISRYVQGKTYGQIIWDEARLAVGSTSSVGPAST